MAKIEYLDVINRINSLGFTTTIEEKPFIEFTISKVTNHILNETAQYTIPIGAIEVAIDMVVGEYLLIMQSLGKLTPSDQGGGTIVTGQAIAQIKDGDTTVVYQDASKSGNGNGNLATFDGLLNDLLQPDYDWGIWRKYRW